MRICYITYADLGFYGAPRIHVSSIAEGLVKLGHKVTIFAPPSSGDFEIEDVEFIPLKKTIPTSIGWGIALKKALKHRIDDFDIFYVRDYLFGDTAFHLANKFDKPSLLELNGILIEEVDSGPRSLKDRIYTKMDWNLSFPKRLQIADKIISVSPDMGKFIERFFRNKDKLVFLPNGVNIKVFKPVENKQALRTEMKLPTDKNIVGIVGSILSYHINSPLLESMELIAKAVPDCVFLIVGGGPAEEHLAEKISESSIEEKIIRLDRVPIETSAKYIACLDVALTWIPRTVAEGGWPMRMSAYAACGVPAVGPDWGSYNVASRAGGLVESKNGEAKAIADNVISLLKNPDKIKQISIKAREWAEKELAWKVIADKTAEIMQGLI